MKIFATSDLHGNRTIMDKLEIIAEQVDMILICGDITGKHEGRSFMEISKKQREDEIYLCEVLRKCNATSYFILGNDDWIDIVHDRFYMDEYIAAYGIPFVPFEWVPITPFNTNREANENKLRYELSWIGHDNACIVVAHTPPYGVCDQVEFGRHVGSKSARTWIEQVQPRFWLCGHIHEAFGANNIDNTIVLNCACDHKTNELRGWLIDTDTNAYAQVIL